MKTGTEPKWQHSKTAVLWTRGTVYRGGLKRGAHVEEGRGPLPLKTHEKAGAGGGWHLAPTQRPAECHPSEKWGASADAQRAPRPCHCGDAGGRRRDRRFLSARRSGCPEPGRRYPAAESRVRLGHGLGSAPMAEGLSPKRPGTNSSSRALRLRHCHRAHGTSGNGADKVPTRPGHQSCRVPPGRPVPSPGSFVKWGAWSVVLRSRITRDT